jgi:predicted metal-dependent RNase
LASWWMMDWWAIQNYLELLEDPKNLFISAWYQWENTLWYDIFTQKVNKIEIPEKWLINIHSKIHNLRWFSGHADEEDLLTLLSQMKFSKDAKIIINHWEKWVSQTLFWLAIKWVVWKTRDILIADFDEKKYKS